MFKIRVETPRSALAARPTYKPVPASVGGSSHVSFCPDEVQPLGSTAIPSSQDQRALLGVSDRLGCSTTYSPEPNLPPFRKTTAASPFLGQPAAYAPKKMQSRNLVHMVHV